MPRSTKRARHAAPVQAADAQGGHSDRSGPDREAQPGSSSSERSLTEDGSEAQSGDGPPARSSSPVPLRYATAIDQGLTV